MLQRAIFLYAFFVVAVVSTGAAVWQKLETNLRDEQLADASRLLVNARTEARTLKERATTAERRVRLLEAPGAQPVADGTGEQPTDANATDQEAKLRAELAAARQQLSAAETAIKETEDRLASEISDHAALKIKAQELSEEIAATGRNISAVESKAAAGATGSLPDNAASETVAAPVAGTPPAAAAPLSAQGDNAVLPPADVKKKTIKRASKPVIRAVKPIGSMEPML